MRDATCPAASSLADLDEVLRLDPQNTTAQDYLDRLSETLAAPTASPFMAPSADDESGNDAAAAAGRPAPAIVCSIPVWVTDDPAPARAFLAQVLAGYATLPSYRAMMDVEGVAGLGDLSIVGSEAFVRDAIGEISESGATDFTPVPMGGNPDEEARTVHVLVDCMAALS